MAGNTLEKNLGEMHATTEKYNTAEKIISNKQ